MRCRAVQEKLNLYAAGELLPSVGAQIESHLQACPTCRKELAKLRQLETLLRAVTTPPVPEGFAVRVLAQAKERALAAVAPRPLARRGALLSWERLGRWMGATTALAAGLMLGVFMGHATWQAAGPQQPVAVAQLVDPLATSSFEYLIEPGGDSLAQAYLQLTSGPDG